MEKEKISTPEQQPAGAGRVSNIDGDDRKRDQSRDISSIDRQEGEMDNGETGGNFKTGETSEPTAQ